jgi:hypothetical protein
MRRRERRALRTQPIRRGLATLLTMAGLALLAPGLAAAEPSETPFELVPGSFSLTPSSYQAGAHADWTLSFDLAHNNDGKTFNDLRSTLVNYPAGFMGNGNADAFPTCTLTQLLAQAPPVGSGALCPPASQVGTISFEVTLKEKPVKLTSPLYNMEVTSRGVASLLGYKTAIITQTLPVVVRPTDSGLTGSSIDTEEIGEAHKIELTVWGVPAAHEHDAERGMVCGEFSAPNQVECEGGGEEARFPPKPFLANPTSCGSEPAESMKADSWEEPQPEGWLANFAIEPGPRSAVTKVGPFVECERIHFDPAIQVKPSTPDAESPSGLSVALEVPQTWENPYTIATSNVKDVTVTLPAGYTVNPSDGNGLAVCTPAEYEAETAASTPQCPPESKLGTVSIETPLLAQTIGGDVYLAQPYDNVPAFGDAQHPGGSLLALYVVAKEPVHGIVVKTAGKVVPDPVTGQLTSTFEDLPQQAFSRVTFDLKQGVTSPLVSPPACGTLSATATMAPSSDPSSPRVVSNTLTIEHGIGGGACPPGGVPPFKPAVVAGTNNNAAGRYSPFYLRVERQDGEQEITGFSTLMPPGLTGNLTDIPFCSDAQIAHAREQTGAQAETSPACPAASQIGTSIAEAGVGSILAQTPGKLYLAGPFEGAPFSVVDITSAKVGPFDLGTVVVHLPLLINQTTAQVSIPSGPPDQIPHIIDGIVIHLRDIRVYINRPDFMINPTSCEPMSVGATVIGAGANVASPTDDQPVSLSDHFQAADCQSLAFKPTFTARASGKTSKADGTSLHVSLSYPKAAQGTQANIKEVKVELPKQLPSRLSTLQKACTSQQFKANPAGCPAASVVGHAKAVTPILPVALEGPAYFVSYGASKFPELVLVLQGYGVTIDLHGETFISKAGITSSTFKTVPDQPVASFELTLPAGPNSALTNNGSLCKATNTITVKKRVKIHRKGHIKTITRKVKKKIAGKLLMPTTMIAQNGAEIHHSTTISVSGCGKAKAKAKHGRHKTRRKPHHSHRK